VSFRIFKKNPIVILGHTVLNLPQAYNAFQSIVGARKHRSLLMDFVTAQGQFESVIDLGCGTGFLLERLTKSKRYVGVDLSEEYLAKASRVETKAETQFVLANFEKPESISQLVIQSPSLVLAMGIFHHLSDDAVLLLRKQLEDVLPKNSLLISLDPTIDELTTPIARWVALNDRGNFVRSQVNLEKLFAGGRFYLNFTTFRKQIRIPTDIVIGWCYLR